MTEKQFKRLQKIVADESSNIAVYYHPAGTFIMGLSGDRVTVDVDKKIPFQKVDIKSLGFYKRLTGFNLLEE